VKLFQGAGFEEIVKNARARYGRVGRKSRRRHVTAVPRSICWRGSLGWCKFGGPFLECAYRGNPSVWGTAIGIMCRNGYRL